MNLGRIWSAPPVASAAPPAAVPASAAPSAQKQIITAIERREKLEELLHANPGLLILKFGAEWCRPCKQIAPNVHHFFASCPVHVLCGDIDVDESMDLYSFLKSKRVVNGIPVIMCWKRGNINPLAPDDAVTGANLDALNQFFFRCKSYF